MPDNVDFDEAAFTTIGAIAMQGIRRAQVQFGDNVAVIGLGLLGQIAC
jgi:polar amino acid transport system substrate-binding protein